MLVSTEALASRHIVKYLIYSDDDTLRRQSGRHQLGEVGEYSRDSNGGMAAGHARSWSPASAPRGVTTGHAHEGHANDAGQG